MADRMAELARQQPGFLGAKSVLGADGFGITVSYWESGDAIQRWKAHSEHELAQQAGQKSLVRRLHSPTRQGRTSLRQSSNPRQVTSYRLSENRTRPTTGRRI